METDQKEKILTWAKDYISEHGDMTPILHVFGDKGYAIGLCQFDSPEAKHRGMFELGQRVITDEKLSSDIGTPKEIVFLSTAWYISIPADDLKGVEIGMVAPSQDPDRKEALLLVMSTAKGKADCEMFKINRTEGSVSFEAIWSDEKDRFESNLTDLFWEGVASVAPDAAFKEDVVALAIALSTTKLEGFSSDRDRLLAAILAAHVLVGKRLGRADTREVTKILLGVTSISESVLEQCGIQGKLLRAWANVIAKSMEKIERGEWSRFRENKGREENGNAKTKE